MLMRFSPVRWIHKDNMRLHFFPLNAYLAQIHKTECLKVSTNTPLSAQTKELTKKAKLGIPTKTANTTLPTGI